MVFFRGLLFGTLVAAAGSSCGVKRCTSSDQCPAAQVCDVVSGECGGSRSVAPRPAPGGGGGGFGGSGTGGGSGEVDTSPALCSELDDAQQQFFAGRSSCSFMNGDNTITLPAPADFFTQCEQGLGACNTQDRVLLEELARCLLVTESCLPGSEQEAGDGFVRCLGRAFQAGLSTPCQQVVSFTSP